MKKGSYVKIVDQLLKMNDFFVDSVYKNGFKDKMSSKIADNLKALNLLSELLHLGFMHYDLHYREHERIVKEELNKLRKV